MTESLPLLHYVVSAIAIERPDRAADCLTALGFSVRAFEHEQLGLQIRFDWDHGFELIAPTVNARTDAGGSGLPDPQRDDLFSVIVRTADCDESEHIALRYDAKSDFRQHVEGDGFDVTEMTTEAGGAHRHMRMGRSG